MRTRGREFPADIQDAPAFLLTPAGAYGPAFLALENFLVIKRYNMSDLYALFVGNLADRIAGGGDFETPWASVRQLPAKSVEQLQERMQGLGYAVAKVDGKAGMNTRSLVGAYQKANGLKVDCWPTEAVLTHMQATTARGPNRPPSRPMTTTQREAGVGSAYASGVASLSRRGGAAAGRGCPCARGVGRVPRRRDRHRRAARRQPHGPLDALWPAAHARGISRSVFDRFTADFVLDPEVVRLATSQPEHVKPPGAYISTS